MQTIVYIQSLPNVAETNDTLIAKKTIRVVPCYDSTPNPNVLCGLWNVNRCPNDDAYCNPFVKGDKIYLQYAINSEYLDSTFEIIDNTTGLPIELGNAVNIVETQTVVDKNETTFVNLVIDTANENFNLKCFYFKLNLYKCDFKANEEYLDCRAARIANGESTYFAKLHCYAELCTGENAETVFSEPYCEAKCINTILIEGNYPQYDCNGNYYGPTLAGVASIHKPSVRIYGEINQTEYNFEETLVNRKRTRTRQLQAFVLLSQKLPKYVVDRMAVCFNSKNLYIDGIEYIRPLNLSKNFEEGSMWIIKSTLLRECDEINFTCE